jgi:hypothetical protein
MITRSTQLSGLQDHRDGELMKPTMNNSRKLTRRRSGNTTRRWCRASPPDATGLLELGMDLD